MKPKPCFCCGKRRKPASKLFHGSYLNAFVVVCTPCTTERTPKMRTLVLVDGEGFEEASMWAQEQINDDNYDYDEEDDW